MNAILDLIRYKASELKTVITGMLIADLPFLPPYWLGDKCLCSSAFPTDAVRTSAWQLGPFLSSKAATAHMADHTETAVTNSATFYSYVTNLPDHIKRTLGNLLYQQINVEYWMTQLQEGNVSIASDGSVATK